MAVRATDVAFRYLLHYPRPLYTFSNQVTNVSKFHPSNVIELQYSHVAVAAIDAGRRTLMLHQESRIPFSP
jgi:hypothetical protein